MVHPVKYGKRGGSEQETADNLQYDRSIMED